ncbi:DUF1127 domain-containing protein [Microvirga sp. 2TAF3]|uniref:DUF1127 domain-containing protein n=1 Tax=Microvirga sp. 2TAF3 TaxID=3233014 RepID=UPI003F98C009
MSLTLTHEAAATGITGASRTRRPSLLARFFAALAREIRVRRDMRLLSGFDEAALHDIGLVRGGVEDAVRYGRPGVRSLNVGVPEMASLPASYTEWR